jgi:hypothetical protein
MSDDLVKNLRELDKTDDCLYETMDFAADRIEELEAKPVLRRLEWDNFDAWTWWAEAIGGVYHITERNGAWRVVFSRAGSVNDRSIIYEIDDFETAQAAAQYDHDEKLLRWIMPPAPPSRN